MKIRTYVSSDLSNMQALTERSQGTNRTRLTWEGNRMMGGVAYNEDKLVGAIPLEPREFSLGLEKTIPILWVTGAHVDSEFRRQGLGRKIYNKITESYYPEYDGVFVYRGEENSLAYKWYIQLGFQVLLPIISYKIAVRQSKNVPMYDCIVFDESHNNIKLYNSFQTNFGEFGGSMCRHQQYLFDRINTHFYQDSYQYYVLSIINKSRIKSYAVLGLTEIRDGVQRFDVLDHSVPDTDQARNELFEAVMDFAHKKQLEEVRIQTSFQHPGRNFFEKFGFIYRWRTNLMGSLINPVAYLESQLKSECKEWKDMKILLETPQLGKTEIGQGPLELGLFMCDNELTRLLLHRTNLMTAIHEGRIMITKSNPKILERLYSLFSPQTWLFHQIDYV